MDPLTPQRPVPRRSRLRLLLGALGILLPGVMAAAALVYVRGPVAYTAPLGALGLAVAYALGTKSRAESHRVAEGRERVREAEEDLERALRPAYPPLYGAPTYPVPPAYGAPTYPVPPAYGAPTYPVPPAQDPSDVTVP
ncbi:hypothetical protein [Streptomyces sp. DSM 118148]|uniref:hypothetical protein n=1 Tax=Streptomyces sp. DSM 118148 TaxID=3448667 RepID=UPI00404014CF